MTGPPKVIDVYAPLEGDLELVMFHYTFDGVRTAVPCERNTYKAPGWWSGRRRRSVGGRGHKLERRQWPRLGDDGL